MARLRFLVWIFFLFSSVSVGRAAVITALFDSSITDSAWKANINYAVGQWNSLFRNDPFSTTITFRADDLSSPSTAGLAIYDTLSVKGYVATSTVKINSNTTAGFFVDATPGDNSEFQMTASWLRQNPSAAPNLLLSGIRGPATAEAAKNKWDFLSVVEHEIGHCLGIGYNGGDPAGYMLYENAITAGSHGTFTGFKVGTQFQSLFSSGQLPVTEFPTLGSHFDGNVQGSVFDNALMADPGFQSGQRSLITDVDILGVGSLYTLESAQIALVPEPGTIAMLATLSGIGCFLFWRNRKKAKT